MWLPPSRALSILINGMSLSHPLVVILTVIALQAGNRGPLRFHIGNPLCGCSWYHCKITSHVTPSWQGHKVPWTTRQALLEWWSWLRSWHSTLGPSHSCLSFMLVRPHHAHHTHCQTPLMVVVGEEQGYYGSKAHVLNWSKDDKLSNIIMMLNMDMIGNRTRRNLWWLK